MDFVKPRADLMSSFHSEMSEVLAPTHPLGAAGATAAPAVVVNASWHTG
jgi:hypothetical protein